MNHPLPSAALPAKRAPSFADTEEIVATQRGRNRQRSSSGNLLGRSRHTVNTMSEQLSNKPAASQWQGYLYHRLLKDNNLNATTEKNRSRRLGGCMWSQTLRRAVCNSELQGSSHTADALVSSVSTSLAAIVEGEAKVSCCILSKYL
jgi:hypothetical protein